MGHAKSGSWSIPGNWIGPLPTGAGLTAVISQSTASNLTVTLDEPVTLGTLELGNSGSSATGYAVIPNQLTMNNNSSTAQISVSQGTHAISVPVEIANGGAGLAVTLSGGGNLAISGNISEDSDESLTLTVTAAASWS